MLQSFLKIYRKCYTRSKECKQRISNFHYFFLLFDLCDVFTFHVTIISKDFDLRGKFYTRSKEYKLRISKRNMKEDFSHLFNISLKVSFLMCYI